MLSYCLHGNKHTYVNVSKLSEGKGMNEYRKPTANFGWTITSLNMVIKFCNRGPVRQTMTAVFKQLLAAIILQHWASGPFPSVRRADNLLLVEGFQYLIRLAFAWWSFPFILIFL